MKNQLALLLIVFSFQTAGAAFANWDPKTFHMPSSEELKKTLTQIQYDVTQNAATERAYTGQFWNNEEEGIYVDVVSGEPLFDSTHKFDSQTGWPSFYEPLVKENIIEKSDHELKIERTEVRSKYGNSHLGHVFKDGPQPTGLRYCINSAALRFIPQTKLKESGYGQYLKLFKKKTKNKNSPK